VLSIPRDPRSLTRAIRAVEDGAIDVVADLAPLWPHRRDARVLGITGPPGAGKSTLCDEIVARLRAENHRVAVLAVDPSSPISGGAILGDRVRMQRHAADPGVFIRSLASRGQWGGLSRATLAAVVLAAAAGYDRIVLETVGVGQTEMDVVSVADLVCVVLVPEAGDVVQALKAGVLEGADLYAINKADRPGADLLARELQFVGEERAHAGLGAAPPVHAISALRATGLDELWRDIRTGLDGLPRLHRLGGRELVVRLVAQEAARRAAHRARTQLSAGGPLAEAGASLDHGDGNPWSTAAALLDAP
jgi:LAO/AO transport system kinase